ncbi:hypothetical protein ACJIZ3_005020 [Penstemon smallii]|uniref:Peptidase A1 domain-containing protein n=1 Tax=Penstemon smallii TaxID=265156 RepID=A0ABD3S3X3_9LAMI
MAFCPSLVFPLFLLLVSSYTHKVYSYSTYGEKELLSFKNHQWTHNKAYNQTCFTQKSRTENGATILEMKHRDFCSRPINNWNQKLQKRLIDDDIRVKSIQSRIKNIVSTTQTETQVPITSGIKLEILNYIVTVTLGGRNLTVIVDTGSDLTWVQCQPCKLCYTQPEPLFNPLISPSYQLVNCSSHACNSLQFATGNFGSCGGNANACNYVVTYGDGSYTRGELGKDNLVLGNTQIGDFVFGCGQNNKGLFGAASGLMGLGRSELSLISQTFEKFSGVFSYCLPDTDSLTSGSLIFGNDSTIYENSTPISYTRLLQNPQFYSFYVLNLTGTSIGGVDLQSPRFGQGGILIDSGTVISRLPPSIYKAIKNEFLKQFTGYPTAPSFSILDTCFNLSAYEEVNIPTLKMKFEGNGELSVDVAGMFYFVKRDASQVCLALASLLYEDEIGIIGNYQQRNTRVVYDTKDMKLGFAKESCTFS